MQQSSGGRPREPEEIATSKPAFDTLDRVPKPSRNETLWLTAKRGELRLGLSRVPPLGRSEILVRNQAIALNPIDRLMPLLGDVIAPWLAYPAVLGSDVAGEVVAVGEAVRRFRVGDRVLGHALGLERSHNATTEGAFQHFTVLFEHMAAPIPEGMGFSDAAVLPLGLSTAACGLFGKKHLALQPPGSSTQAKGEGVLIWGASTSVGSNAVQLAVAAGYEVVATCSPRNFDYVRRLGAGLVFDYKSPTVVDDIVRQFQGKRFAGALAIGTGSARACVSVAGSSTGRRAVAMVSPAVSFERVPAGWKRVLWLVPTLMRMGAASLALTIQARRCGAHADFVWGGAVANDHVGPMIYVDYLPQALKDGRHAAAPPRLVAGHGLEAVAAGLERLRAGVSARKVVVTL